MLITSGIIRKDYIGYIAFIEFVVLLPLMLLYFKDAMSLIVRLQSEKRIYKLICWSGTLTSLALSIVTLAIGLSIQTWIIYNLFIEQQDEFRGNWLNLLGGVPYIAFGLATFLIGFRKK